MMGILVGFGLIGINEIVVDVIWCTAEGGRVPMIRYRIRFVGGNLMKAKNYNILL